MPIIDTTGIRPIERRQPTEGLERVRRRDEGGSGFRPQTNVNLKAAIQDIAATLGKIVAEEKTGLQRLPKEIGDVVKNILQQALSVDSTLGKGIGSTIESQRFSMEQLVLFSRMLSQMGTLAERGYSMRISEDTQALMTQFKAALVAQAGGEELEPVLITKTAFELVDAKTAEQLPPALYEILSQLAQSSIVPQSQQPPPSSESMQFLKQLIKFFMPRPGVDVTEKDLKQQEQNQSGQRSQTTSSRFLDSMFRTLGGRAQPQAQGQPTNQFSQPQAQGQPTAQFSQPQAQGQPTTQFTQPQAQGQPTSQFAQPQAQGQPTAQFTQPQAQSQPTNQFTQPQAQGQPTNQFAQPQSQGQPTAQFTQPQAQSQPTNQFTQPQAQGQPTAQFAQPQAQGQPTAQFSQPQAQGQPTNQFTQPQAQGQPTNQFAQPQAQSQPTNQFTQPQAQGQPTNQFTQPQAQGQPTNQFSQPNAQGQLTNQFSQPNAQGQPTNQYSQPQAQGQPTNQFSQPQSQGQPTNQFAQPQAQSQPTNQFTQPQAQSQPTNQFTQPQAQSQPTNQFTQPQAQGQPTAQYSQPQAQGQPTAQFSQPQAQSQPTAQFSQPQAQSQPTAQYSQPQAQSQPTNQFSQPQAQGQPTNQFSQPQAQSQPMAQFAQPQAQSQPMAQFAQPQAQGQPTNQFSQPNAQGQPTNQFTQPQAQGQPTNQFTQPQAQGQPTAQFTQPQAQAQSSTPQVPLNQPPDQPLTKDFVTRQKEMRHEMKIAKESMIKQNILNTPQTNDAMKGLAQFLLRGSQMTPRDAALLQNFVNNSQQTMSETEARHLQNLLRLCQQNVPLTVQQAAVQQKLPDLPRLWAFMQMCDMANIAAKTNPKSYKRASKDIADFTNAMRRAMTAENSIVQDKRSFQMMMPLYMGDDKTTYPTYLSIYDENERDEETGEDKKETWLRICVLTDYIGAAELVFRVYDETKLDMRFYFSRQDVAEEFRSIYLDDLRNSINQTQLNVGEVRVGGGSERMFSF